MAYFAIVFLIGFMLGVVRVLVFEPRLGSTFSVAVETPLMLLVSWFVAGWAVRRFAIAGSSDRLRLGLFALALLVLAETLLGLVIGQSLIQQLYVYWSPRGAMTLIGQIGFATIPMLIGSTKPTV